MFSLAKKSLLVFGMVMVSFAGTEVSANADPASFINAAGPAAQQVHKEYNIPASVVIGQAADESRYGQSKLSTEDNNYFGFKCLSKDNPRPGPAIGCKWLTNSKGADGAYYRVYASITDSFRDYGRLVTSSLYSKALPYRNDPDEFIRHISLPYKPAYSTNPNYAAQIIEIMRKNNLYRFNA